jgi:hypothetical protein
MDDTPLISDAALRLAMGELTSEELLVARAAYRLGRFDGRFDGRSDGARLPEDTVPQEVKDIFSAKCPKCGCTGLHACPGAPMQEWTQQEKDDALAAMQRIHDREAETPFQADTEKFMCICGMGIRRCPLHPGSPAPINSAGYAVIEKFTWDAMLVFPENGVEVPLKKRDDGRYEFDKRYGAKGHFRVTEEMVDRGAALSTSGRQDDPRYREKIRKILEAGYNV